MFCQRIRMNEVKDALRRMKNTKAMGSVEVPLEFQKCFGDVAVCLLTNLFNKILSDSKGPSEWRRSTLIPIYKDKGDI